MSADELHCPKRATSPCTLPEYAWDQLLAGPMPMTEIDRDIALIEELLAAGESSSVEFKENNFDADRIGKLCSALSNSARIDGNPAGYVLWGIRDNPPAVIGTETDPSSDKVGNQLLEPWLHSMLDRDITPLFRNVSHPRGKVVILEIPPASTVPVLFNDIAYVRCGSSVKSSRITRISMSS